MKNIFRRTIASALIAVTLLGVMGATTAGIAGAQSKPAAVNANVGHNWHYDIALPVAGGRWDAILKQNAAGKLTGFVDPPFGDCAARAMGHVNGNSVNMTWTIGGACQAETVKLSGTVKSGHISGTVMDSLHGKGTFTAGRDL